jgi:hypothetical protein
MSNREKLIRFMQAFTLVSVLAGFSWLVALSAHPGSSEAPEDDFVRGGVVKKEDALGAPDGFIAIRTAGGAILYQKIGEEKGDSSAAPAFDAAMKNQGLPTRIAQ